MQQPGQAPRKSKQQRLADAIEGWGALGLLRRLHDRGRSPVVILAYHRIADPARSPVYPLDLGLVSATPAEFDAQMRALREFANPVSLDCIADAVTHGRTLPQRAVAVTFDDGFSDTYEVAFPVLQRHGIPATVFVSTEHVEHHQPFWFEVTAHLMLRLPPRALSFEECPEGLPLDDTEDARRAAIVQLHRVLKTCSNPRRHALVRQWSTQFAAHLEPGVIELSRSIDKQRILEMARAGIGFGSHTASHPNLALADTAVIERELRDSKNYLTTLLDRPIRSLAYPFGTPDTYDARAMAAARACGYELAVSYRQGPNWLGAIAALELRRIGISPGITPAQFRAMLALSAWLHPNLDHDAH
jgi:peptidoglycan/xylan/chitin deacetylase (PgdA/CDA1 family)